MAAANSAAASTTTSTDTTSANQSSAAVKSATLGGGAGGYAVPSEPIASIVNRVSHPSLSLSPDRTRVLVMHSPPVFPPVAELAREETPNMAGMRLDSEQRTQSRRGYATALSIMTFDALVNDGPLVPPGSDQNQQDRRDVPIEGLPSCGVRISDVSWSPDGKRLALLVGATLPGDLHRVDGAEGAQMYDTPRPLELWIADVETRRAAPLYRPGLLGCGERGGINCTMESYEWLDDERIVATAVRDEDAVDGTSPASAATTGPRIEEALDTTPQQARTYADLLRGAADANTFVRLTSSQVLMFNLDSLSLPASTTEAWPASVSRLDADVPEGRIYTGIDPDDSGSYAIVSFLKRPFSYTLPCGRFPVERHLMRFEDDGRRWETVRVLANLPMADSVPVAFNSTREGPRGISWNPASVEPELVWAEAQDGGDPDREVDGPRDIVYRQLAEGEASPRVWFHSEHRYSGCSWHEGGSTGIVFESWWRTRNTRWWLVGDMARVAGGEQPADTNLPPRLKYIDRNYEDVYSDPGSPLVRKTSRGTYVIAVAGDKTKSLADAGDEFPLGHASGPPCYIATGTGQSEEGSRPFVDIISCEDPSRSRRLYHAKPPPYESLSSLLSEISMSPETDHVEPNLADGISMWCSREDLLHPSQQYLAKLTLHDSPAADLGLVASTASTILPESSADNGDEEKEDFLDDPSVAVLDPCVTLDVKRITEYPHPHPQLQGMTKKLVRYKRESDGVELTAKLYLPPGYDKERDGPLPCLLWAYPKEFKSREAASQVRGSPHTFAEVGGTSPLVFACDGYAVLDGPGFPIVGEADEEPNDTYVEQLVDSAKAAIDHVAGKLGVVDRNRVAVGGHSYGAFMTANLLCHSDLFCCGIARSGAYNRTLTPFGFQSEERTLWEATDTYMSMSPFLHVKKMTKPILLIHGEDDTNSGTHTMQSERMYAALKGAGVPCRMVILPHEKHGYRGLESVLHTVAETEAWLERYCKNGGGSSSSSSD